MKKIRKNKSIITLLLSFLTMIILILLGGKATAQETGGSDLSLDNVRIKSFKIIDVLNGNKEIDYRTSDNSQYVDYQNDPSKFSNAFNEGQTNSIFKIQLSISYSSKEPLKEGDKLVIPASLDRYRENFASKPLLDETNHQIGVWEYKDGNIVINFSGDYIKNNRVTQFTASFETGETSLAYSGGERTTKFGERNAETGKLGKQTFIAAREKVYVLTDHVNNSQNNLVKYSSRGSDSVSSWKFNIESDTFRKTVNGETHSFVNPYMLENNGAYSPKVLTDIYLEDTISDVIETPELVSIHPFFSGIDDEGKVVSGSYGAQLPVSKLKLVPQGDRTKDEVKASLNKGEYSIYDNKDGSYTLMLKWWDMDDPNGPTYDDIPAVKRAGGVGNYLKNTEPTVFGVLKPETIQKINEIYKGKAIQNVFFYLYTKHVPVKEKTEIPNTAKFETKQTGLVERKATSVLTPSAGIADAPADALSIKLLKTDVKTGKNLSEGFKFELQVSDDGTTWNTVDVNNEMIVKGTLNSDKTLTPNESGIVEVKRLINGKKYRFFEKAHADEYKDVTEDNAHPNTTKTPTAANSRVVEINVQGSGKVIVMYNEQKPEMVKVEGTKTWDDADNQDGKRPAQITVNLLKNGQKVASKTVTEADGWKWTFDNLDKYENGKEITYTIEEEAVEGYTTKVNGFNITNTYTPAKTSVQVTKKWDDADDKDGKRPTSVTMTLYANGEKTDKTLVLNKENNWTGSFTEVDEYKAGKKIDYSVQEEPVGNGYVSEISGDQAGGFTVTNTRKPDAPVTTETPTTPVTTTTEERGEELPNTGTTASLAVIGFLALIGAVLVLSVKTKKV